MIETILQNRWACRTQRMIPRRMISLDEEREYIQERLREAADHHVSTLPFEGEPRVFF